MKYLSLFLLRTSVRLGLGLAVVLWFGGQRGPAAAELDIGPVELAVSTSYRDLTLAIYPAGTQWNATSMYFSKIGWETPVVEIPGIVVWGNTGHGVARMRHAFTVLLFVFATVLTTKFPDPRPRPDHADNPEPPV